ncbi:fibronectin type III domain-containing protein [Flavobacterium psychrophilum]|nr:fibronectin type III domain-containing protein [Flavobacterium psychrophilum]
MIRNLFQLFFLLISFQFFGQVYPVQITPIFNTPYSSRVSDYATSMDVKMQLLINPSDISITNRQVRLKMYLQGNNINAQSVDYVNGINPIYINGGELLTLTNLDIAALFRLENLQGISPAQYSNALPEGMYNVCFELYDFATNQRISQKSCAYLYLMLNDPPLLNTPAKNESIAVSDFPNILFTWTPRQLNATNVSYEFEIKEILDPTIDPQIGFLTSPTLYDETLYSTALLYDISKPNLLAGKRYAWRVRAMSTSGLSLNNVFKNDGYSEIHHFTYASNCPAPTFILSEALSARSVRISWQGDNSHTKYHIQYKKANIPSAEWFEVYTMNTQTTLSDLEAGVTYEFRVGGSCEPAVLGNTASFTYSGINNFTLPAVGTTSSAFTCGLNPAVAIANQTPLQNLLASETFTAGDFPVKVLEVTGSNGIYSGNGYIVVPYLADTKIKVSFENITINTNYQLIDGVVETGYDPEGGNIIDLDPLIDEIFGPQTGTETSGTNNTDTTTDGTTTSTGGTTTTDTNTGNTTENTETNPDANSNNPDTGSTTAGNNSNTNNNSSNNTNSTGTNVTGNDYYIEYKGKKYYTGGKIKIPYKRIMLETFEMKTVSDTTKVDFTIHEPGKQEMWRGYTGSSRKTTIPIEDITLKNNLRIQDLVAQAYKMSGKPKVVVEVEKVVTPFTFTKLEAIDLSNKERIADAGEILYYINKPTVSTESKNTSFKITTSPNLTANEIPVENIKWKFNDTSDENKNGVKDFSVYVNENKNVKVTGITGFPNSSSKNVNVKWVDEDRKKYQVVPPAIQSTTETVFNNLTKLNQILASIGINDVLEIKPKINMSGSQFNEIDKKSRHYNIVREGEINASVEAKASFNAPPPYSGKVKIPFTDVVVVDYGLYLAFKLSLGVQGKLRYEKREDKTEFLNTENSICIKGSGGIEPGLKLNILPGQDNLISVTGKAYGKAEITAAGCYNFTKDEFNPKVELTPLVVGFNLNVKTGGVSIFDNSYELTLSDKIKIYGK